MNLFFRAFLFSIPRHAVMYLALIGVDRFEFSPLPSWTAWLVTITLFFFITYFFAEWALIFRTPSWKDIMLVYLVFLLFGTFYESAVFVFIGGYDWQDLFTVFSWDVLYLVILYAVAVAVAGMRVRRRQIRHSLPEGLES